MARQLASYENPPVVEVVLGVQFELLQEFTSAHLGWFWKSKLNDDWQKTVDVPELPDQQEPFGSSNRLWVPDSIRIQLTSKIGPDRLQIVNTAGDRMIQLQQTRFIFNWISRGADYPRFGPIKSDFENYYSHFRDFVKEAKLGAVKENQWELVYVNRVPKGDLWKTPADWHNVFPVLLSKITNYGETDFESLNGEWRSVSPDNRTRLRATVRYHEQQPGSSDNGDLLLTLTARGPIDEKQGRNSGFELGHSTIVYAFEDISSDEAQRFWGKK